jgi:Mrp family chromosome partitioning ATPase
MIKVTSKIAELRRKIRKQIQKSVDNSESERAVLMAREKALQDAMGSYEKDAMHTNRKELQYAILEREVEANRNIYNVLLAKIKEANITDEITKTNLRLVEPATLPVKPIKPRKGRNLALSAIFGLLAGVGLTFFLEYLDQTLHNREELEWCLNLPVLSEIPTANQIPERPKKADESSIPSVLTQSPNGRFGEAFSTLATNLRFSDLNQRGVYLITSSAPKEGKSTTCFNLGLTMAQLGRKTLVIDADLRLPKSKKPFSFESKGSLTDILADTFSTPITQGTLGELGSGDIHRLLQLQEKSGILRYENETNVFTVSFHQGRIISIDWPSRPTTARLGSLLMGCGKISKEQAQIAIAKQKSTSQQFGQVLMHLGFLTPEELAGPLKLHLNENMRALTNYEQADYRHADFTFEEDHSPSALTLDPTEAALREAMGDLDGFLAYPTPFLHGEIQKCLLKLPEGNLWILPSGKVPANPVELLASSRARVLIELLREKFDMILVDTPPVATLSDAAVLAPECDGVILVIQAGETNLKLIKRAYEQLEAVQAKFAGVVLNMLDAKKDPYYYGRYASKYQEYYQGNGEGREEETAGS